MNIIPKWVWKGLVALGFVLVIFAVGQSMFNSLVGRPVSPLPPVPDPISEIARQDGLLEASEAIDGAARDLDTALGHIESWDSELATIDNETQSAFDGDPQNAELLRFLKSQARISKQQVLDAKTSVAKFRQLLDSRMASATTVALSPPEQIEFRRLVKLAETSSSQWSTATMRIQALKQSVTPTIDASTVPIEQPTPANGIIAGLKADLAAEKLIAESIKRAKSPDVLRVLAPFTESRYEQPKMSGASVRFIRTSVKQPMSLTAIQNAGALASGIDGLKALAKIGSDRELPEPKWSVRPYPQHWSDGDQEMLENARRYLLEYGAILVKEGLLSE